MEIRNGFIDSVFNYCDRWCETCPFTGRCRLFADMAEEDARRDPSLKAVIYAPPLPRDRPTPPPQWLLDLIDEMNAAAEKISVSELSESDKKMLPEHQALLDVSRRYRENVRRWLYDGSHDIVHDSANPVAVIAWFHTMIRAKVFRAEHGLAGDDPEFRDGPADHDGSAKVALLGIERSHAAWLQVVERGIASDGTINSFLSDLVWLGEELERVFPNARAFVRPAFDEPDQVAKLLASEASR